MPIASVDCPCDTGADVCCDTLFLKGDRIRTVAWNAVLECRDETCCGTIEGNTYMAMGPVTFDPHGDSVIVSLVSSDPVATTNGNHTASVSPLRTIYKVEVRFAGWPTIQMGAPGSPPYTPTAAEYASATKHVMGHAEKAYRAVLRAAANHSLFVPAANPDVIFKGVRVSDLRPMQPRSVIAGMEFGVAVDIAP